MKKVWYLAVWWTLFSMKIPGGVPIFQWKLIWLRSLKVWVRDTRNDSINTMILLWSIVIVAIRLPPKSGLPNPERSITVPALARKFKAQSDSYPSCTSPRFLAWPTTWGWIPKTHSTTAGECAWRAKPRSCIRMFDTTRGPSSQVTRKDSSAKRAQLVSIFWTVISASAPMITKFARIIIPVHENDAVMRWRINPWGFSISSLCERRGEKLSKEWFFGVFHCCTVYNS